jgi:hypothetical protein
MLDFEHLISPIKELFKIASVPSASLAPVVPLYCTPEGDVRVVAEAMLAKAIRIAAPAMLKPISFRYLMIDLLG